MFDLLSRPWPWYIAGPLIGLTVPLLLILGNRQFGLSSNLRHLCAAICPGNVAFFRYDWKAQGSWNLAFAAGILAGGAIAGWLLAGAPPDISIETRAALARLGIGPVSDLVPPEIFTWSALLTLQGFVSLVIGGFLVGFGTAYAGGCTSGHAIAGLAHLQLPSLVAVVGFFAGGLLTTFVILPWLLR
ncbi:MAG TPA: YeeE/YedE thiosulfate transporter family protein [Vicinamibacterales bacterium]|nr:YeeE/YedE thiosulfate transporter family protein [Vicinamibacterales bacterium]